MPVRDLSIGLFLFFAPIVSRGAILSEMTTLEYDVLSADLNAVTWSSVNADCSAYRPLFDLDIQKPDYLNKVAVESDGFQVRLGDLTAFVNNSMDYGIHVRWSRTVSLTGTYKFTGRTGSGLGGWLYSKNFESVDAWASDMQFAASVNLFPTVFTFRRCTAPALP